MTDTVQSMKLSVDGHQAHYLKAGSGPPVVLLHGGASDSSDWMGTMRALSSYYSFYAPDIIGYGLSDHVKSTYHLEDFVRFTGGFIQEMSLDKPVLIGHSLGGRICLEIAFRYPEMVSKLVLIDTMGFSKVARLGSWFGTLLWGVRKALGIPQPYPAILPGEGEEPHWPCLEQLPGLQKPTLIVWKRFDLYFPVASAVRAGELIPKSNLVVFPGYGHAPHRENRGAFNKLLLSFLNSDGKMK